MMMEKFQIFFVCTGGNEQENEKELKWERETPYLCPNKKNVLMNLLIVFNQLINAKKIKPILFGA